MRIYLPATLADLAAIGASARIDLPAGRTVFGAPDLPEASADETEEWEFAAMCAASAAAADAAIAAGAQPVRVVLSLDVPNDAVTRDETSLAGATARPLAGVAIVCAHVDELAAASQVAAAMAGPEPDIDALAQIDLLWYDASELAAIPGV